MAQQGTRTRNNEVVQSEQKIVHQNHLKPLNQIQLPYKARTRQYLDQQRKRTPASPPLLPRRRYQSQKRQNSVLPTILQLPIRLEQYRHSSLQPVVVIIPSYLFLILIYF